jgi:N utilization substance protein A
VIVPDKQQSLAIGKEGQNVRLAAKLTGWKIDIKSASEMLDEERALDEARAAAEAAALANESALQLARVEHRKVHPDGMISFGGTSFGPLSSELVGETVDLRAASGKLNIYHNDRMIASYIVDEDS